MKVEVEQTPKKVNKTIRYSGNQKLNIRAVTDTTKKKEKNICDYIKYSVIHKYIIVH